MGGNNSKVKGKTKGKLKNHGKMQQEAAAQQNLTEQEEEQLISSNFFNLIEESSGIFKESKVIIHSQLRDLGNFLQENIQNIFFYKKEGAKLLAIKNFIEAAEQYRNAQNIIAKIKNIEFSAEALAHLKNSIPKNYNVDTVIDELSYEILTGLSAGLRGFNKESTTPILWALREEIDVLSQFSKYILNNKDLKIIESHEKLLLSVLRTFNEATRFAPEIQFLQKEACILTKIAERNYQLYKNYQESIQQFQDVMDILDRMIKLEDPILSAQARVFKVKIFNDLGIVELARDSKESCLTAISYFDSAIELGDGIANSTSLTKSAYIHKNLALDKQKKFAKIEAEKLAAAHISIITEEVAAEEHEQTIIGDNIIAGSESSNI